MEIFGQRDCLVLDVHEAGLPDRLGVPVDAVEPMAYAMNVEPQSFSNRGISQCVRASIEHLTARVRAAASNRIEPK
jgi:hypothetical protein